MASSLFKGEYLYDEVYPSFKSGTDEKEKTALLNGVFLKSLARQGLVLKGPDCLKVADIGCGPGDTVIKYLKGLNFDPGYSIRGTDFLPHYAGSNGLAAETLLEAQTSGALNLRDFSVKQGNAFSGKLVELLSTVNDPSPTRSFALSFLSHLMYHAEGPEAVNTVLLDISKNVLEREGVGVLYHVANRSKTGFQYFRAKFGSRAGNTKLSDTPAVNIQEPPQQIAASCQKNGIPCFELQFTTKLRFEPMPDTAWAEFADPGCYSKLEKSDKGKLENLKRLYFIVQRAPREFAEDRSPRGLLAFLEEVREVITKNAGVIYLEESLQALLPSDSPRSVQEKAKTAVSLASDQFSQIERESLR